MARAGCVRCHNDDSPTRDARSPIAGAGLVDAVRWRAADGGAAFLRAHHGGQDADAIAAWLLALGATAPTPTAVPVSTAAIARGERLVQQLACGACHAPSALAELGERTDHARLAMFLANPTARVPAIVHPPLAANEADDVAAFLLRSQLVATAPRPGFQWAAWQRRITEAGLPDLAAEEPIATGIADRIDAAPAPRANHFVLRFTATLDVPTEGEWTFITGSDDSSWLWIDEQMVVRNEGLAPHRRRDGTVRLTAGPHALRVMFTQGGGGSSLEVLWRGPGVSEQVLPADRASAIGPQLVPPSLPPALPLASLAAAVERGRLAARARRCDACHAVDEALFAALPAPSAPSWRSLRDAPCPQSSAGQTLRAAALAAEQMPRTAAVHLATAMLRDGCTACHRRDGSGGLAPAVLAQLPEVEDLGDEGRLPPDLTAVGRRLRPAFLEKVLSTGQSVRPYLRVRMPKLGDERARQYAAWFAEVDGGNKVAAAPAPASGPAFSLEAVQLGRQLAGTGGRNCITCHSFQGHPSLGAQGMDLAIQHERLRPEWFTQWLLHPSTLRPGTRMPTAWLQEDDAARREVSAIAAWLSLGAAAPLPVGIQPAPGSTMLIASDRPRLHGAFLEGVSARCLAVGTAERTHFAFDLATSRLVWLWRGDFLDAGGTWNGRAGKLVKPAGADWRVLGEVVITAGGNQSGAPLRLRGQRITKDGYPVLQIAAGATEYEDEVRPRLVATGSEVVRTLRALRGALQVQFPPAVADLTVLVDGVPAASHVIEEGRALEVVYRW